jgi:hypothetical protein
VATVHNAIKELGRVLPCPSAIFHMYASTDTPWVAQTISHCTPVKRGKVSSNLSTHEVTQFGDSICPVCVSTFKCLFIQTQQICALIDTGTGYHLGALNFVSDHPSSFPSDNTQSQEKFYASQSNHVMFQLWTGWSFCQSMPDLHQLSTPTQGNQNIARTPVYKKCYNYGQKSHFANVCPNQRYCPDVTMVATSTPNCQVNSTMSTIQQQFQQRPHPTKEQGYAAP